ncbi:unnamed protein product [Plutella xylostella]|uniref:(diamondback moth) hypothetical protein n=1 Tax=Plutella xylostella TaxID=51655 RepID=A0A8S4G1D5_PLUXY|nr:unnamed protein product [Plutella xylostella]
MTKAVAGDMLERGAAVAPALTTSLLIALRINKLTSAINRLVVSAGVTAAPRSNMSPATALVIATLALLATVAAVTNHESNRKYFVVG